MTNCQLVADVWQTHKSANSSLGPSPWSANALKRQNKRCVWRSSHVHDRPQRHVRLTSRGCELTSIQRQIKEFPLYSNSWRVKVNNMYVHYFVEGAHLSNYFLRDVAAETTCGPHSLRFLDSDASVQPPEAWKAVLSHHHSACRILCLLYEGQKAHLGIN